MRKTISGIQQIGIGVKNLYEAWEWYAKVFSVDVRVFEDSTVAELMLPYTGGQPRERHAALALNMQGGGGFEIWQYRGRIPVGPDFDVQLGDLGLYAAKIKCKNAAETFKHYTDQNIDIAGGFKLDPDGKSTFYVKDPYGNYFQLVEAKDWFKDEKKPTGATYGAIIGVSNIENALTVYKDILNYDEIVYDKEGIFEDFKGLPGGDKQFRRILLRHTDERKGPFAPVLGRSEIELVQVIDRKPKKIFENRLWGDLGFIHLCFDIHNMKALESECNAKGFTFTVDSNPGADSSFDMGDAAGHFTYIEDPDGTLIEFVETHKVPILKKIGLYVHLKNRDPHKSLPKWMLKAMGLNRVKFDKN